MFNASHIPSSIFSANFLKTFGFVASQDFLSRCSMTRLWLLLFSEHSTQIIQTSSFMEWFYYPLTHKYARKAATPGPWRVLWMCMDCDGIFMVIIISTLPRDGADLGDSHVGEAHSCSGRLRGSKKLSLGANKRQVSVNHKKNEKLKSL